MLIHGILICSHQYPLSKFEYHLLYCCARTLYRNVVESGLERQNFIVVDSICDELGHFESSTRLDVGLVFQCT